MSVFEGIAVLFCLLWEWMRWWWVGDKGWKLGGQEEARAILHQEGVLAWPRLVGWQRSKLIR